TASVAPLTGPANGGQAAQARSALNSHQHLPVDSHSGGEGEAAVFEGARIGERAPSPVVAAFDQHRRAFERYLHAGEPVPGRAQRVLVAGGAEASHRAVVS